MWLNIMCVVFIPCMCRHCDTVIRSPVLCVWLLYGACAVTVIVMCSPMLCEWLLYCARVATVIQLYVDQCYVSGYYTVHVSSL
jgi:hypothetical protein